MEIGSAEYISFRKKKNEANRKYRDANSNILNEKAKSKRLRLKAEGKLILTEEQKLKKKISNNKYSKKLTKEGKRKKLTPEQKIKRKEYLKVYNENNSDSIKERSRIVYLKRKGDGKIDLEKHKVYRTKYVSENKERVLKLANDWRINKRNVDSLFVMKCRLRGRTSAAFKNINNKKPYTTNKLIGTDWDTCKNYLESLFKEGMNWENRSKWHIDHIIPLASAKTEEEMIKLCHYTNLQPLWAVDNIKKGSKMPINI